MAEQRIGEEHSSAPQPPAEGGTLLVAGLLILALGFAGYWITVAATSDATDVRPVFFWFGMVAGTIVMLGITAIILYRRRQARRAAHP